ncbi:MAG TPA: LuxR C-terminal-related transcriptional regulator [Streptosporangiaceae bacterium]|nr:LuxR C-terminal-related transcriptional regulator [Streptosporangiaceae bacterium]
MNLGVVVTGDSSGSGLPRDQGSPGAGQRLLDRHTERAAIDRVLESVRDGFSATLVIRGCPGAGKTALLGYATDSAPDMQVCGVTGIQTEIGLEFASLHQLLVPFLPLIGELPAPQRQALQVAFGQAEGPPAGLFLVGLAALTLLAHAAEQQPVLCLIDDAQWLDADSALALAFVARRLYADRVGMLIAASGHESAHVFEQLPSVSVHGLPAAEAGQLLRSVAPAPVDSEVVDRILTDTERIPLALVEVGAEFSADELAGRAALPEPMPLGRRLTDRFRRKSAGLDPDTRELLLLMAAEGCGNRAVVWHAAQQDGIDAEAAAAAAESAGVIELSAASIRFRHPLIRSAAYHTASDTDRRRAHQLLSAAADPDRDPDLCAWHRSAAATGPDEGVAVELERAADRAQVRGGYAARAALLRRSAELSGDGGRRAARELRLASAELTSGHPETARDLVDAAEHQLRDPRARALAERLRGDILFVQGRAAEAAQVLAGAARSFAPDQSAAREAMASALRAAIWAGPVETKEMATVAQSFPRTDRSQANVADLMLEGYTARFTAGYAAAVEPLRAAIDRLRSGDLDLATGLEWYGMGTVSAASLWDDSALDITARFIDAARSQGAVTVMPVALGLRGIADCLTGALAMAQDRWTAMRQILATGGSQRVLGLDNLSEGMLLVFTGRLAEAKAAGDAQLREATAHGVRGVASIAQAIVAMADVSAGNYDAAIDNATAVIRDDLPFLAELLLPELIEAACRTGRRAEATSAFGTLSERTLASGTAIALGVRSRCAALLSDGGRAEHAYQEAIDHLEHSPAAVELARAHLHYGQWLRRSKRRRDARLELRAAYDMFDRMGAEAFAARAATELSATGERVQLRSSATNFDLTPQEARVAGLAVEGVTNNQIAAELFISPRTVEYHLRKVFRKLGVSSRSQLARHLPASPTPVPR